MNSSTRTAGYGLLLYVVGVIVAFVTSGPGGEYEATAAASFVASDNWLPAFTTFYVGALSALGLLVFAHGMRHRLASRSRSLADGVWALGIIGTALGIAGWVLSRGIVVAFAEGGTAVRDGVSGPVVYTLSEIANLMALCAPALCLGLIAFVLAARGNLPGWLRVLSWIGGFSGIVSATYFPLPFYLIWMLAFAIWAIRSSRRTATERMPAASIV